MDLQKLRAGPASFIIVTSVIAGQYKLLAIKSSEQLTKECQAIASSLVRIGFRARDASLRSHCWTPLWT